MSKLRTTLLCITCFALGLCIGQLPIATPKFHHDQLVSIEDGYFAGRNGRVVGCISNYLTSRYIIQSSDGRNMGAANQLIWEHSLTPMEKK